MGHGRFDGEKIKDAGFLCWMNVPLKGLGSYLSLHLSIYLFS